MWTFTSSLIMLHFYEGNGLQTDFNETTAGEQNPLWAIFFVQTTRSALCPTWTGFRIVPQDVLKCRWSESGLLLHAGCHNKGSTVTYHMQAVTVPVITKYWLASFRSGMRCVASHNIIHLGYKHQKNISRTCVTHPTVPFYYALKNLVLYKT